MVRFSQRHGYSPVPDVIQVDSITDDLRNRLWNAVTVAFLENPYDTSGRLSSEYKQLIRVIWHDFFKWPLDGIPEYATEINRTIRHWYFRAKWNAVYDFVEFLAQSSQTIQRYIRTSDAFVQTRNSVLTSELSAWRFIGRELSRITSDQEIEAATQATSFTGPLAPVSHQLQEALRLMSDRQNPNYRDSIKNSINAVETTCKLIAKQPTVTLGIALNTVEQKAVITLHKDLSDGFKKLYHWTSDAHGIRHGLMDQPNLDIEDARFMLVSCSTFINYLVVKAQKAGINL